MDFVVKTGILDDQGVLSSRISKEKEGSLRAVERKNRRIARSETGASLSFSSYSIRTSVRVAADDRKRRWAISPSTSALL